MTNSSGYGAAGQKLYELAVKAYDEGIHLPIWGTCLGQEMILYLAANQTDWMTSCLAENKADSLTLQPDHEESLLFREMPKRIKHFLQFENTTVNFHEFCSTPENFTASGLIGDFRMLATSFDYSDLEYVAMVEHRKMPIFASQFHPEMTPFQWPADGRHNNIPHSSEAVQVSHFFADFFVSQARFNDQHFQTPEEEREALIYNYQTTFTGYEGMIYTEVYLFR
ncbi:gamma-glutamyl hydrolase-like [Macrobrachium nipponense]|uniref:gamma-glutamyl hydrolase-like n=1 Tax=Macrobrachium nipponense TaxID=159736 RepID=UPI0030C7A884